VRRRARHGLLFLNPFLISPVGLPLRGLILTLPFLLRDCFFSSGPLPVGKHRGFKRSLVEDQARLPPFFSTPSFPRKITCSSGDPCFVTVPFSWKPLSPGIQRAPRWPATVNYFWSPCPRLFPRPPSRPPCVDVARTTPSLFSSSSPVFVFSSFVLLTPPSLPGGVFGHAAGRPCPAKGN